MKHKKQWLIGLLIILIIGIGGKWYMDEQEKAKLHEIQTDLANYLYNNYRLYTVDEAKDEQLNKEYNRGEGSLTTEEFLKKSDELKEYSDIKKVEFTSFSIGAMNTLEVYFTINDVYEEEVDLDTISAETEKFIYSITNSTGNGPYYIEKKDKPTKERMPEDLIVYDEGGIN
ncbi:MULTISPECIES: hypothetical protein [Enterococcus]|uniref:hypothetical protein n=1 Tax=Enterococcus TaxID=1350 RepID=UPI000CF1D187|nr:MULTISPECIES: hypothetical protein [Enterococcus]EHR4851110.1 hypothetical protein [Enterococcus faecalis]EMC0698094.1 hypothetical protein [Enterococcus faecalis]MDQ8611059.1 hypothetical protein [Enterococcus sp. FR088]NSV57104.1 hypothetical protein [Enterococcus faecalis]NSV67779.1 hypothetical protein [Enterococcus faecalis]